LSLESLASSLIAWCWGLQRAGNHPRLMNELHHLRERPREQDVVRDQFRVAGGGGVKFGLARPSDQVDCCGLDDPASLFLQPIPGQRNTAVFLRASRRPLLELRAASRALALSHARAGRPWWKRLKSNVLGGDHQLLRPQTAKELAG